ncbi:MAG: xanthine dehydrogenase family protein molybdopterin-binding subunit [Chloroflexi bacterium]|nr:xanthine dehydrogenase family protein molybdopterin-binding subunit [Chloroflexota bacterium]
MTEAFVAEKPELVIVGKDIVRVDALEKATGRAKYVADFGEPVLYARVIRSPYPHANILSIDTSRAESYPGVRGVVTPKDAPATRIGYLVCLDRQVLPVEGRVRYVGEPVAVVVADTPDIAEEAANLVDVKYEILPAVFDAEEAIKETCPVVLHPQKATYRGPVASLGGCAMEMTIPNTCSAFHLRHGDIERGFREADIIVENRYSFDGGSHARPEPTIVDAWVDGDVLTVRVNRSRMWACHSWLCRVFSMPPARIRLIVPYQGGFFGGKGTPVTEALALLAALKTGRRVRLQYSREEEFWDTNPRPTIVVYVKDGMKRDGTIVARQTRFITDIGAYGAGGGTLSAASSHLGIVSCYRIPNWWSDSYTVYTNNPPTGTMRGVEAPQGNWAIESNMDCVAHALGMDPLEFRRKNVVGDGDVSAFGQVLHDIYARECLDKVAELIEWGKRPEPEGKWQKGKGMALANWMPGPWWPSAAFVKLFRDGTIEARIGTDENGQGVETVISQIVAEEFRVPVSKVKIVRGDTRFVPWDWGSIASRTTWMTGTAVVRACQAAKQQVFKLAARRLKIPPDELELSEGRVFSRLAPDKALNLSDLFAWEFALDSGEITGEGSYEAKFTEIDPNTGYSPEAAPAHSYLAYGVEVAVNTETAEVKVLRVNAALDIGQPINWKMCEGQIEGGIGMGLGCVLYERFERDRGVITNADFVSYRVPTAPEVPSGEQVKSVSVGRPHPDGPHGAKALGEVTLVPFAAAVGNAVFDATGVRITDAPLLRERVFKALRDAGQILTS